MIVELFTWLSNALTQSPEIAILAAFIWGLLWVILSPCHIACIPLIVGFIDGQGNITTRRAFGLSLLFGLGILITIGIIGLITGLLGRMIGDIGGYGSYFVAIVFFAVGLNLLGILPLPFMEGGSPNPNYKRQGLLAAFILGLLFGIALDYWHLPIWPRCWVLFSAWLPPKSFLPFPCFWPMVSDTARFSFSPVRLLSCAALPPLD